MKPDEQDREMMDRVTAVLNESLGAIETPVLGRLAAMRAKAVELVPGRRYRFAVTRWVATAGMATAAVIVAVSLWFSSVKSPQPVTVTTNPDDVEMLTSRDRMEL